MRSWTLLLCGLTSSVALAQAGFDAQRFTPAAGAAGGLQVERPIVPRHLGFGLGLIANYSDDPVVVRDPNGAIVGRPLDHALTFNVLASLGLFDKLELALDLPVHALYAGDSVNVPGGTLNAGAGVGDLRFVPKFAHTWRGGVNFSVGAAVPVTFPTGSAPAMRGNGGVTVNPQLLLGLRGSRWGASANAGVRLRPGSTAEALVGNELTMGLGTVFALIPRKDVLDLMLEVVSAAYLTQVRTVANLPVEALAGLSIHPHPDWSIDVGGGVGITRGLGDPRYRLIAGVRYAPKPASDYADSDNDGVSDNVDRCPTRAEDQDGFEDEDGCPESDNDHDGVVDDRDECPDEAEGRIGDGDGCPEGEARYENGRIVLRGKVQFETGSTNLKPKSQRLLDQVAHLMKENPDIKVRVEGHTDEVGPAMNNQQLSERRANTVREGLIARGISSKRLSTKGWGEGRPVAPNKTAAGRAKNRRVEFIVR
jgi:OOP family OmpA-OmpF porin